MFKNPFDFSKPFGVKRTRRLFGAHTTPREWKHGARDIPFGLGAKSLHVDGTKGHDSNDGESWKTAVKTIMEAVDTADSWTQIFVKAGTYAENVAITDSTIHLIGENKSTTIISPAAAHTLDLQGNGCIVNGFTLKTNATLVASCRVIGNWNVVSDCILDASVSAAVGIMGGGDYNTIHHIKAESSNIGNVCGFEGDEWEVYSNWVDNANYGVYVYGKHHKIHDNEIRNSNTKGIYLQATATDCSVYHNNLVGNTTQVHDAGSGNKLIENFYDDHTNVDNGFGIAKAPYAFTGGTDPRPVVTRNGWHWLSWADADQVADILADVTGIAGAAMRGTDSAALASVCTEARLAELAAANLPADIDSILADIGNASGATLGSIYGILGNPATTITAQIAAMSQSESWSWNCLTLTDTYEVISGTWTTPNDNTQYLGKVLYNSSSASSDEIAIPFFVFSTDAITLNLRGVTGLDGGITTVYVDGASQGTIDMYSGSAVRNAIKTLSITPARVGLNILRLKITGKNPSSADYILKLSELWLS